MVWTGLNSFGSGEIKNPVNTVIKLWVSLKAENLLNSWMSVAFATDLLQGDNYKLSSLQNRGIVKIMNVV